MANQHSDDGVDKANATIESLDSKGATDQPSDEHVSAANASVGSSKSSENQDLNEGVSIADVALERLKSKDDTDEYLDVGMGTDHVTVTSAESSAMVDKHSDEGASIADIALESIKSKDVADKQLDERTSTDQIVVKSAEPSGMIDQHSDEGVTIADVALESLKSKVVEDETIDDGASKTNLNIENSESKGSGSTLEINIKTLDSQLHNFNVNKNMQGSVFKEKIASEVGLPVEQQRLIFRGKVLKDEDLLSEYHVESGHTLPLVDRQPSEFQNSAVSFNTGEDANVTGARPPVGHVSHSVVLGTCSDQDEGNNPDVSQVIGEVLNSFGIGAQAGVGGIGATQLDTQFSSHVQTAHGNETGANVNNHDQTGNRSQPISLGAAAYVPTRATPIPHSLYTLSEFMNHMQRALSHNGHQPSNSTESVPAELPTNARGLLSTEALAFILRQTQRLLSGPTIESLSHTTRRLEEEEGSPDDNVRTEIHTEAMQCGVAMQHLGALLLELGRTLLTLRIGQSHAESSVNAGPAVYISASGPNPIMVQPFPLQTSSLFGDHTVTTPNPGFFDPIGVGAVPRHVNIHIHAGPTTTNVESNRELTSRNAGVNWQTRSLGNTTRSGDQDFIGQADVGLPDVRTDVGGIGNATSSSMTTKSLRETEVGQSSSRRSNVPIPIGLGSGGLQPQRRHQQTTSEVGSSNATALYSNQILITSGGQMDLATIMNQVMQNPALSGLLANASNQAGTTPPDFMRNLMSELAQNLAMMNTVNQLAQQMDGNQDGANMLAGMGGSNGSGDISSMVQQMMPFVSQSLNRGNSSSNLLQRAPSRKPTLHRRHSSVKNLNINERSSSDFRMNLENAAQKIVEQYPPIEIFSSIVETAATLHNNVFDQGALDDLCMEEELAQEFVELLKRDISQRLQGRR